MCEIAKMAVGDFIPAKDVKQTIEKEVKEKPKRKKSTKKKRRSKS